MGGHFQRGESIANGFERGETKARVEGYKPMFILFAEAMISQSCAAASKLIDALSHEAAKLTQSGPVPPGDRQKLGRFQHDSLDDAGANAERPGDLEDAVTLGS
jgi:hypothetical protein